MGHEFTVGMKWHAHYDSWETREVVEVEEGRVRVLYPKGYERAAPAFWVTIEEVRDSLRHGLWVPVEGSVSIDVGAAFSAPGMGRLVRSDGTSGTIQPRPGQVWKIRPEAHQFGARARDEESFEIEDIQSSFVYCRSAFDGNRFIAGPSAWSKNPPLFTFVRGPTEPETEREEMVRLAKMAMKNPSPGCSVDRWQAHVLNLIEPSTCGDSRSEWKPGGKAGRLWEKPMYFMGTLFQGSVLEILRDAALYRYHTPINLVSQALANAPIDTVPESDVEREAVEAAKREHPDWFKRTLALACRRSGG